MSALASATLPFDGTVLVNENQESRDASQQLVNVGLVTQQIVPTLELSSAERALVSGQLAAAFAQVSGQGVRPRVTFPALVTGERRVVIDAVVVPLRVWNRSQTERQ